MQPYYTRAEQLYQVHGARGEDPTEPPASTPYPHPAVSHEPRIQQLADDLRALSASLRNNADKLIRDGDLVFIDIGAMWNGYFGDIGRTVVCGEPSPAQRRIYRAVWDGLTAGIEAMRPGATNAEVTMVIRERAASHGLGERFLSLFIGHGIGCGSNEPPYIGEAFPGAATVTLEAGMVRVHTLVQRTTREAVRRPESGAVAWHRLIRAAADAIVEAGNLPWLDRDQMDRMWRSARTLILVTALIGAGCAQPPAYQVYTQPAPRTGASAPAAPTSRDSGSRGS